MKNRKLETLSQMIKQTDNGSTKNVSTDSFVIMSSPSDVGVMRNRGRNGARFAPRAILNSLKKLTSNTSQTGPIEVIEVTTQESERLDFHQAQINSSQKILELIKSNKGKKYIHLGGGHDHAFPLLLAINNSNRFKNIVILNIDAHCDTRIDDIRHSGTPFRDFDQSATKDYHLIQYGIQLFSNSASTLTPLKKGTHQQFLLEDLMSDPKVLKESLQKTFDQVPFEINHETAIFFSLDCDAIKGESMKAVSAVNGRGLDTECIHQLLQSLNCAPSATKFFGIYEYNPVYDDLSQLGARTLGSMLYKFI